MQLDESKDLFYQQVKGNYSKQMLQLFCVSVQNYLLTIQIINELVATRRDPTTRMILPKPKASSAKCSSHKYSSSLKAAIFL